MLAHPSTLAIQSRLQTPRITRTKETSRVNHLPIPTRRSARAAKTQHDPLLANINGDELLVPDVEPGPRVGVLQQLLRLLLVLLLHVVPQVPAHPEGRPALRADVPLVLREVDAPVPLGLALRHEPPVAQVAAVRPDARVHGLVARQLLPRAERLVAVRALERPDALVQLLVAAQQVDRAKLLAAQLARVRLLARVYAPVRLHRRFGGETRAAQVALVALDLQVDVVEVTAQLLDHAEALAADVAYDGPGVGVDAYVAYEGRATGEGALAGVALVAGALADVEAGLVGDVGLGGRGQGLAVAAHVGQHLGAPAVRLAADVALVVEGVVAAQARGRGAVIGAQVLDDTVLGWVELLADAAHVLELVAVVVGRGVVVAGIDGVGVELVVFGVVGGRGVGDGGYRGDGAGFVIARSRRWSGMKETWGESPLVDCWFFVSVVFVGCLAELCAFFAFFAFFLFSLVISISSGRLLNVWFYCVEPLDTRLIVFCSV